MMLIIMAIDNLIGWLRAWICIFKKVGQRKLWPTLAGRILLQCGAPILLLGGQIYLKGLYRGCIVDYIWYGSEIIIVVMVDAATLLLQLVATAAAQSNCCWIVHVRLWSGCQGEHAEITIDLLLTYDLVIVVDSLNLFLTDLLAIIVISISWSG